MCTVWHVDKYKITFKLVTDARARYRPAARRLRNRTAYTLLISVCMQITSCEVMRKHDDSTADLQDDEFRQST